MKHSCSNSKLNLLTFFDGILLLCVISGLESATVPTFENDYDRLVLLDFKNRITQDPLQIMRSWNDSIHFCSWFGVTCSPSNKRVMVLNLEAQKLAGSIPPSMGNLTYLTGINLQNNSFHGEIPQEMGRLRRLQHLNLSDNSFGGKIPTNISHCTEIRVIDTTSNKLIGQIPDQLSSLSKLVALYLGVNNLTGTIPAWIGNFSSLYYLSLLRNNLQGGIPSELGCLSGLEFFQLASNNLSGTIPPSIYNISSSYYFCVTQNQLHGSLPPDVGLTLPNLQVFLGGVNNFTGPIPVSLSNASQLLELDFSQNGLTGPVPQNLGSLQGLIQFNFENNSLGNRKVGDLNFLSFFANCTSLVDISLAGNQFGGVLPSFIANLSTHLKLLTLGGNMLHGSIPIGIGNLVNLDNLGLEINYLSGPLPAVLGKLHKLEELALAGNKFSGLIPYSLGNLTSLILLYMEENKLEGSIPPSLGNCQNLLLLNLSSNNLNGTIPKQVIGISSLSIYLDMSRNYLTGPLPLEVGNLKNLGELDLSENKLSGEIPSTLGSCSSMERLHLEGNSFEGAIPQSLNSLKALQELDLSRNNLSGQIPEFLSKFLLLKHLNLSYNDFKGKVPSQGIFANATAFSILGNHKLCSGVPELLLPTCSKKIPHSSRKRFALKVAIPVISVVILVFIMWCFFSKVRNSRKIPLTAPSSTDCQVSISYSELVESTNGFSEDNMIGSGSFGSVYKGILSGDGTNIVAVKVLNLQLQGAPKSFIDECNVLRSIRHRNLLKIITACSSIDRHGNDFKALIFEFMSNGNLDQWLHPQDDEQHQSKSMSFIQRLNVAIDVASALEYLHHHCETPIVHCDLKPSNVLLDKDMVAHVGDFGLSKFLFEASHNPSISQTMSGWLKGSIGYIPPEYGMGGQVSILGDIYSYGILLLELFTGKRPTNDMFNDDLSIHKFTAMALPENVMDIVDPSMHFEDDEEADDDARAIIEENDPRINDRNKIWDCVVSVLQIGLLCSTTSPHERMHMNVVVNKIHAIRDFFLKFKKGNKTKEE